MTQTLKKAVFFPDKVLEHMVPVRERLSRSYLCIQSSTPDEFRQTYLQAGGIVLLFSHPKAAVDFVHLNLKELEGVSYKAMALLDSDRSFDERSRKILESLQIKVYPRSLEKNLLQDIDKFMSLSDTLEVDELEFNMPADDPEDESGTPEED